MVLMICGAEWEWNHRNLCKKFILLLNQAGGHEEQPESQL